MKRRILVIILTVLVVSTGIILSAAEPSAEVGQLIVTLGKDKYELEGEMFEHCSGGNVKKINLEKTIRQRYDSIYAFDVPVDADSFGSVKFLSPMSVTANGARNGDVQYTVYSYDGTVLRDKATDLSLPKKDIDGCIVEVEVKWGNAHNYKGYKYFFAAIYKRSEEE